MKQMPRIEKVMTPMPHTIGRALPIKTALDMMKKYSIRHLPVQEEGKLVGIITDRDVRLATSFEGVEELKVEDVMVSDPYSVEPQTPLDAVTEQMAEHKYGCAIVRQGNGKVVGIFTLVDGMRFLSEMMREHYKQTVN